MTSTDDRTVLEAFKDALVDAMAQEMTLLRAPRDQWEVAAQGVMDKMGVRGMPAVMSTIYPSGTDAVLFNRQPRAELPPVLREKAHGEDDGPVIADTGVGVDGAPGQPA